MAFRDTVSLMPAQQVILVVCRFEDHMIAELRQMVNDRDEFGLERAFFNSGCPHFFAVDWREDDADIVADCAEALELELLTAEWRDEELFIIFNGQEARVPLQSDAEDRHITICALNDLMEAKYEIRFLVFSLGSDTLGFAALSVADWRELEKSNAAAVAENFIDPRKLPNLMTELTEKKLPTNARVRFERLLNRNKTK
jgi:hypothetical protein